MQITTPPPVPPAALTTPQDVTKAIPQVQAQAAAPDTRRAVDPSSKSERGNESRSSKDRAKGGGTSGQGSPEGGGSVNIRV